MSVLTISVQIQFDQYQDGDPKTYSIAILDEMNKVLQREFNDISPLIFTNSIDDSDITTNE